MRYYLAALAIGLLATTSAFAQQSSQQDQSQQQGTEAQSSDKTKELSSSFVKAIQARLHQQGYLEEKPTGVWDEETADALENFQESNGLNGTGKVDGVTILALGVTSRIQQQQMAQSRAGASGGGAGGEDETSAGSSMAPPGPAMPVSPGAAARTEARTLLFDAFQAGYSRGFEAGLRQSLQGTPARPPQ